MSALRLIPPPVGRWLYRRIARNRYAMFGRGDLCALPAPSLRARLIG
jgi:predicted DCC family thiol-disulfide oxidoreductase YuxK